jgi:hypothetical protein
VSTSFPVTPFNWSAVYEEIVSQVLEGPVR